MNFAIEMRNKAQRELLSSLVEKCKPNEREMFERIWPQGIASIPDKDLESTINLCHRTLAEDGRIST